MFRRFAVTRRIVKVGLRARNHFSVGPKRSGFEQSQVIRKIFKRPNNVDCPHWLVSQVLGLVRAVLKVLSWLKPPSWSFYLLWTQRLNGSKPLSWFKVLSGSKPLSWSSLSFHLLRTQSSHLLTSFLFSHIRLKVLLGSKPPSWSLLTFRLRFLISRSRSGTLISFLLVSSVGNGSVLKSSQGQSLHHDLC